MKYASVSVLGAAIGFGLKDLLERYGWTTSITKPATQIATQIVTQTKTMTETVTEKNNRNN
ncbi:hypothetical protein KEJ44_02585 [Candidatus Bathyarchaeota archaeon]|nr:hypothetical protein [Candidatus Bathyarchaeota archaeon]